MKRFQFKVGSNVIHEMDGDYPDARRVGNEMADRVGDIQLLILHKDINPQWISMGVFHGNMSYTNRWGKPCRISADYSTVHRLDKKDLSDGTGKADLG